jgi:predicted regulator of Ras-like GTPase activity (Roadblock/LC7/MglB family)
MLTIFKKIFGKAEKKTVGPLVPSNPTPTPQQMQFESAIQMAKVEVAKLSLAAIVAKFPPDIRDLVAKQPDENTKVSLPIQTIVKQLHGGVVRMSLASLHRQAPAGMFKALPAGDKRMVEVPLSEVFKHVKPTVLKRRADQKLVEVKDEDLELPVFNDRNKPKDKPAAPVPRKAPKMEAATQAPECAPADASEPAPSAMRIVAPPSDFKLESAKPRPAATKPASAVQAPTSDDSTIVLPLAKLSADWPEAIRSSLTALDPQTTVALPHADVAPGLARGKIACTWSQLSAWLNPAAPDDLAVESTTVLSLPLKIVAPAFLARSKKPSSTRKTVELDETIPALFSGGQPRPAAKVEPAPIPVEEPVVPEPTIPEAPVVEEVRSEAPVVAEEISIVEAPVIEAPVVILPTEEIPEPVTPAIEAPAIEAPVAETPSIEIPAAEVAAIEPPAANAPEETPAEPAIAATASPIGAAFGEPEKTHWTPAELISRVVKLPGVAGAVVALQEGFPVAQALPDDVNPETVAAFLPQIFGRLNQYAGEMKLGEVDDLLFTTRGAHCLIYRLGTVYFAVLGKPGASLPWNELRLVAAELSRQVQK